MTIKKTIKKTVPAPGAAPAADGTTAGGAAIADRLRLGPAEPQGALVNKKAAMWAFTAGLVALAAAGILTYLLYDHWVYLMPA